ncbi:NIF3 family protein, partial [Vibrio parahaemolyticus V-223/04]
SPYLDA